MASERAGWEVLIVDDDTDIRDGLECILKESGYDVRSATNGEHALQRMAARKPDLLILDLMMPGTNGWALLERLREREDTARIPVAVISAYASGLPAGARALLHKPVRAETVLSLVERIRASCEADRQGEPPA
jgi:CheY-like chemotaxis protein